MAKNVAEKLVLGIGALGLLVLGFKAIRLLCAGAALIKKKPVKCADEHQGA